VFEDRHNAYILLELCNNNSMSELMKRRKKVSEPEARYYIAQLITGLKYLHDKLVIHRDLKLGNLFLDSKMWVKIGDFGLATRLTHVTERKKTICGTPNYIAPEILEGKDGHSFPVDIWSAGVVLYTLLIGKPPFESKDVKSTYKRIVSNKYSFPDHTPICESAQSLITLMLQATPENRPSLDEISDHPFFTARGVCFPTSIPPNSLREIPVFEDSQKEMENIMPVSAPMQAPHLPPAEKSSAGSYARPRSYANDENDPMAINNNNNAIKSGSDWVSSRRSGLVDKPKEFYGRDHEIYKIESTAATSTLGSDMAKPQPSRSGSGSNPKFEIFSDTERERAAISATTTAASTASSNSYSAQDVLGNTIPRSVTDTHVGSTSSAFSRRSVSSPAAASATATMLDVEQGLGKMRMNDGETNNSADIEVEKLVAPSSTASGAGAVAAGSGSKLPRPVAQAWGGEEKTGTGAHATPEISKGSGSQLPREPGTLETMHDTLSQSMAGGADKVPVGGSVGGGGGVGSSLEARWSELGNKDTKDVDASFADEVGDMAVFDGRPLASGAVASPLPSGTGADVWVVRYVDYTSKYGLGFLLNTGSAGVYFNDSTKIVMSPDGLVFQYMERRRRSSSCATEHVSQTHPIDNYPPELQKKVTLLKHFKGYLLDQALEDTAGSDAAAAAAAAATAAAAAASSTGSGSASSVFFNGVEMPFLKKWVRTRHAILFRLSNRTVQVVFFDRSEVLLSSEARVVTFMDKQGVRTEHSLDEVLRTGRADISKRLKYTKDIMHRLINLQAR